MIHFRYFNPPCFVFIIFFAGTCRWGEFGDGGLLWGECSARQFEWFEGNPVNELLFKVAMKSLRTCA